MKDDKTWAVIGNQDTTEFAELGVIGPCSKKVARKICERLSGDADHGSYRVVRIESADDVLKELENE